MCHHRAVSRWRKWWGRFGATFGLTFLVAEIYGLITVGPEATWSHDLQCRAGTNERCPHTPLGRFVIVTVCAWGAAHLGWGRCGAGWFVNFCRRFRRPNSSRSPL